MKNIVKLLLMLFFVIFANVLNGEAKPKIIFGTHSRPSSNGDGCDGSRGICIIIHGRLVEDDFNVKDLGDDMGLAEIEIIEGQLKMNILYDTSKDPFQKDFNVIKDISMDKEVCEQLGATTITASA